MRTAGCEKVVLRLSVPLTRTTFSKIQELSSLWQRTKAEIARTAIDEFIQRVEREKQESLMARAYQEWAEEGRKTLEDFEYVDNENWD